MFIIYNAQMDNSLTQVLLACLSVVVIRTCGYPLNLRNNWEQGSTYAVYWLAYFGMEHLEKTLEIRRK